MNLLEKYKKVRDILIERKIDVYGCDISSYAISEAKNKHRLKVCDIRDGLPYPNNFFDVVVSTSVFEHIEESFIPYLFCEINRISKLGLYLEVPIILGDVNSPWGDKSHVTYMPTSFWITQAYKNNLLIDIGRSRQIDNGRCHNVELYFYKVSSERI